MLEELTELGETSLMFTVCYIIKGVIKGKGEQPDEETQGRVWRGPECRSPWELGCVPPAGCGVFVNPTAL